MRELQVRRAVLQGCTHASCREEVSPVYGRSIQVFSKLIYSRVIALEIRSTWCVGTNRFVTFMLTVVPPSGLKEWRISKLGHPDPSQEAPYGIQADLIFPSADDVRKAFGEDGEQYS